MAELGEPYERIRENKKSSYPDLFEQKRKVSDVPRFLMMEPTIVFSLMQSIFFLLVRVRFLRLLALLLDLKINTRYKFIRLKRLPRLRRIGPVRPHRSASILRPMLVTIAVKLFDFISCQLFKRREICGRVADQTNEDVTAFL